MRRGRSDHTRAWVSVVVVAVGAVTSTVVAPAATAATTTSKATDGLVDVNTNLGYENPAEAGTGMVLSSAERC